MQTLRGMLFTFKIRQHAETGEGGEACGRLGEMSSILRDKSPALPSTACPWRSRCNRPHTGSESVTRRPWGTCTHRNAKTYHLTAVIKHTITERSERLLWEREVKQRDCKRSFNLEWVLMVFIVTSLFSGHRWSELALAYAPLSATSFNVL